MTIKTRIADLEAKSPTAVGRVYRVMQQPGQSRAEALNCYGADRAVAADTIIIRVIA